METVIAWLTGKIAGPVFLGTTVMLLVAFGGEWLFSSWKVSDLTHARDALALQIDAPGTGYKDRLAQSEKNVAILMTGFDTMAASITKLGEQQKQHDADMAAVLAATAGDAKTAAQRAATLLAMPRPAPTDPGACAFAGRVLKGLPQ